MHTAAKPRFLFKKYYFLNGHICQESKVLFRSDEFSRNKQRSGEAMESRFLHTISTSLRVNISERKTSKEHSVRFSSHWCCKLEAFSCDLQIMGRLLYTVGHQKIVVEALGYFTFEKFIHSICFSFNFCAWFQIGQKSVRSQSTLSKLLEAKVKALRLQIAEVMGHKDPAEKKYN